MKVRIGKIEISDVSMDELDELVQRYGGALSSGDDDGDNGGNGGGGGGSFSTSKKGAGTSGGGTADMVILKKFVESGTQGIMTSTLGEMLGRRGKATRGAAREWAIRVGVATDDAMDPFDDCRIGTNRAIRIKPSLMEIAKAHLGGK